MPLPRNVLCYGSPAPLDERTSLRAGPLSLIFEAGGLRYVRLGDREVLRRVYVAVRDRDWGTVPAVLTDLRIEPGVDSFRIAFEAVHRDGPIHFGWHGRIEGDPPGTIRFAMEGEARSTFLRNRIGLCVLHPIRECAGQPCTVERVDGSVHAGTFPRFISPHQPFQDMRAIAHEIVPGLRAEARFEGETFEMEDQRNWTDASFKTYGTPLSLPRPVEVREGTRIAQAFTLTLIGSVPAGTALPVLQEMDASRSGASRILPIPRARGPVAGDRGAVVVALGTAPAGPVPRVGLGMAAHGRPLRSLEVARLRALNLAHLRVDLKLDRSDVAAVLDRAASAARAVGVRLEVALFLSDAAEGELRELRAAVDRVEPPIGAWLVFGAAATCTPERAASLARERLASYDPSARFGGGTNLYFTELNRGRPSAAALDFVCWSMNPQVHAFDNASLVEALEGQAAAIESARRLYAGLPLAVTPITLRPRFNPHRGEPDRDVPPGEPFSPVDPRQMSLFGNGWTVGSLKAVGEGGVDSVTYYETTGRRGVMETDIGSSPPERFPSIAGAVFPLYHALADVGEFAGGEVAPAASSEPLAAQALAVRQGGRTRVLIANLGPEARMAEVRGLAGAARIRILDETNIEEAMRSPEAVRARSGPPAQALRGALTLTLPPFATARVDAAAP